MRVAEELKEVQKQFEIDEIEIDDLDWESFDKDEL